MTGRGLRDHLEARIAVARDVSPDGSRLLLGSDTPGTMQLFTLGIASPGAQPVPLTALDEPCSGRWLPGSDRVLVEVDSGGDEHLQIHIVDGDGTGMRPLVHDPRFIHRLGCVSPDGGLIAYTTNRRNGVDFDVVVRRLDSGEERTAVASGGWWEAVSFSPDGRRLVCRRLGDQPMDDDLFLADLRDGGVRHLTPHRADAEHGPVGWFPDGSALLCASNEDADVAGVHRLDLGTLRWERVLDTDGDATCVLDRAGEVLMVARNEGGRTRMRLHDARTMAPLRDIALPGDGVAVPTPVPLPVFTPESRQLAVSYTSSTVPGDVWLVDVADGSSRRITRSPCAVPEDELVEPELHTVTSFDGARIPLFVYRPRHPAGVPPVVVNVHGGPEAQWVPSWRPVVQYLVGAGYAVIAPNVRGSTGYGKRFAHLDDVRLRLDSVRDLASVHAAAGGLGFDPRRIALMGASYGGYMTLAGLTLQPDLWAAGICQVGISSLVTFLERTSAWRRRFREREYGSLEADRDFLVEASPLTHLDRLRAPLLLLHGRNDPRVPVAEAEQIHAALRARGVTTELHVYEDEGHGIGKLRNRLDAYPRVVAFLDATLRGAVGRT